MSPTSLQQLSQIERAGLLASLLCAAIPVKRDGSRFKLVDSKFMLISIIIRLINSKINLNNDIIWQQLDPFLPNLDSGSYPS